jgi:hypothetical protein
MTRGTPNWADWPDVLAALRAGIKSGKPAERARAAIGYVQLVYGRQLQQKEDEQPIGSDPLDIASVTREQRDKLKRKLIASIHTWLTSWASTRARCLLRKPTYPQPC